MRIGSIVAGESTHINRRIDADKIREREEDCVFRTLFIYIKLSTKQMHK